MFTIKILLVDPSRYSCNITYINTIDRQYQVYENVEISHASELVDRLSNSLAGASLNAIYIDTASVGRVVYEALRDRLHRHIPVYEINFKSNIIDF